MRNKMCVELIGALLLIIIMCACQTSTKGNAMNRFAGTYLRTSNHEFGKEWDTLELKLSDEPQMRFTITRRWKFERVLDGNVLEPEYRISKTSGTFNAVEKCLEEEQTGECYFLDNGGTKLRVGTTEFIKIK
jgi:hypothetical protein